MSDPHIHDLLDDLLPADLRAPDLVPAALRAAQRRRLVRTGSVTAGLVLACAAVVSATSVVGASALGTAAGASTVASVTASLTARPTTAPTTVTPGSPPPASLADAFGAALGSGYTVTGLPPDDVVGDGWPYSPAQAVTVSKGTQSQRIDITPQSVQPALIPRLESDRNCNGPTGHRAAIEVHMTGPTKAVYRFATCTATHVGAFDVLQLGVSDRPGGELTGPAQAAEVIQRGGGLYVSAGLDSDGPLTAAQLADVLMSKPVQDASAAIVAAFGHSAG